MKHALIFLLLFAHSLYAQPITIRHIELPPIQKYDYRKAIAPASAAFIAGLAGGLHQTINCHYSRFQRAFPNADNQFWNPSVSWQNKNIRGQWIPVAITDGYHLTNTIDHLGTGTAGFLIGVDLWQGVISKRKWWHILANGAITSASYWIGSKITWSIMFPKR